jgi:aquaporin Z
VKVYITEFIGTYFIVMTLMLTGNTPLAVAAMVAAMMAMGWSAVGPHYNPALTLALWLRQKISSRNALRYVGAQVLAGVVAALTYYLLRSNWYVPTPSAATGFSNTIFIEFIFSFALALTFLRLHHNKVNGAVMGGGLGLIFLAAGYAAGPISGGLLNPAAAVGPILLSYSASNAINLLAYLLGPAAGAALASLIQD